MSSLAIKISIKRLLEIDDLPKSLSDKKVMKSTVSNFSHYILRLYLSMIEESMYSRRYKGSWEPIEDEEYIEYIGVTPRIHIMELIKDAIEVKYIGNSYHVRINTRYRYPGSHLYLVEVLKSIEYGTSQFNARPIFRKIIRDIEQNMISLWTGYLVLKGVS